MRAGCRKRNAAEGQAGGTGSEAWQLWGLPDACHGPRLLMLPLVRC